MNQRHVIILGAVLLALTGLYYVTSPRVGPARSLSETKPLFAGIDSQKISRIKLEQGEGATELELKDGEWTVAQRWNYPANRSKVTSLLFKVLGLEVSQRVTDQEKNFETLGVTEEAVKKGRGKVTFYDSEGKEMTGLLAGEHRKKKNDSGMPMPTGQYVRRTDEQQVFLVGEPVTVTTTLSGWLETSLVNILSSRIHSITQRKLAESSVATPSFEIVRDESKQDEKTPQFKLSDLKSGEVVSSSTIDQLKSGLENLRFEDVYKTDSDEVKDLVFDEQAIFELTNGQVYQVSTAKKDNTIYSKIELRYDEGLAAKLKTQAEKDAKEKAEREAKEKAEKEAAEAAEGAMEGTTTTPTESATAETKPAESATPPPIELATPEETDGANKKLRGWVFKLPEYIGKKFRMSRADLMQKDEPAGEGTAAAPKAEAKASKKASEKKTKAK